MTGDDFAYVVRWNSRVNARNLEGISHEDSLVQPPGGNCINWIIGHIIVSRDGMLRLLGADPVAPAAVAERYSRGSSPITSGEDGIAPLEELRTLLDQSTEAILGALSNLDPARLALSEGERTIGERIQFLLLHDTYHAGQIGLARRIAGKPGAIA